MLIEISEIKKTYVSCNFCSRGQMDADGSYKLYYPYDKVFEISRQGKSGIKVSICGDCARELAEAVKKHNI